MHERFALAQVSAVGMEVSLADQAGAIAGSCNGLHPIRTGGVERGRFVVPNTGLVWILAESEAKTRRHAFRRVAISAAKQHPLLGNAVEMRRAGVGRNRAKR